MNGIKDIPGEDKDIMEDVNAKDTVNGVNSVSVNVGLNVDVATRDKIVADATAKVNPLITTNNGVSVKPNVSNNDDVRETAGNKDSDDKGTPSESVQKEVDDKLK